MGVLIMTYLLSNRRNVTKFRANTPIAFRALRLTEVEYVL